VVNQLFKHSSLQTTYSMNMLALVGQQPHVLSLDMMLRHFLDYRREVVRRRTGELERARERLLILEGLKIASTISTTGFIATIRQSRHPTWLKDLMTFSLRRGASSDPCHHAFAPGGAGRQKILDGHAPDPTKTIPGSRICSAIQRKMDGLIRTNSRTARQVRRRTANQIVADELRRV